MGKLKLQVLIVPIHISTLASRELDPHLIRRFLHLTDTNTSLSNVIEELGRRYEKLYPDDDKLIVERIQDKDMCDLDPDFEVGDIFQSGEILRVIVSNPLQSFAYTESTPIGMKLTNLVESTPILPPAPVLTDDTTMSSRKRNQMYFKKSDPQIPSKMPKIVNTSDNYENKSEPYPSVININKVRSQNDVSMDESNISLPPPETMDNRAIPVKIDRNSAGDVKTVSGSRITSGMLNVPPHTKIQNADVIDSTSSPPNNNKSILSSESSWSDLGAVSPSPTSNPPIAEENAERENISKPNGIVEEYSEVNSPKELKNEVDSAKELSNDVDSPKAMEIDEDGSTENVVNGKESKSSHKETISKEEVLEMFKQGISSHKKSGKKKTDPKVEPTSNAQSTLIKSLQINMVGSGFPSSEDSRRLRKSTNSRLNKKDLPDNINETADKKKINSVKPTESNKNDVNSAEKVGDINSTPIESRLFSILNKMKNFENRLSSLSIPGKNVQRKHLYPLHDSDSTYSDEDEHVFLPRINLVGKKIASTDGPNESLVDEGNSVDDMKPINIESEKVEKKSVDKDKSLKSPGIRLKEASNLSDLGKVTDEPKASKLNKLPLKSDSSSDEISESNDSDSDSDSNSANSKDESMKPRLAASIPSLKKTMALKASNPDQSKKYVVPEVSLSVLKNARSDSVSSQGSQGYHTPENSNDTVSKKPVQYSSFNSKLSKLIRKPTLTSLDDLAMRGLPEVKDSSSIFNKTSKKFDTNEGREKKKNENDTISENESDSESENSDSDSSDSDSSDSDSSESESESESDIGNSDKFLDMKKLKKKKQKKKSNVFYSLMRDAKNL